MKRQPGFRVKRVDATQAAQHEATMRPASPDCLSPEAGSGRARQWAGSASTLRQLLPLDWVQLPRSECHHPSGPGGPPKRANELLASGDRAGDGTAAQAQLTPAPQRAPPTGSS